MLLLKETSFMSSCATPPLSPINTCPSDLPTNQGCLVVKNLTGKDVLLRGELAQGNVPCATVSKGTSVTYIVEQHSMWSVLDAQTQAILVQHFQVLSSPSILNVVPPSPSPPDTPSVPCRIFPWSKIMMGWTGILLVLGFLVRARVQKPLTAAQQVQIVSGSGGLEQYQKMMSTQQTRAKQYSTFLMVGVIGLLIFGLLWCLAAGPCSSKPECHACNGRGNYIYQEPPSTAGWWPRALCKYLGRCNCEAPDLEARCKLFAAQQPAATPAYSWWDSISNNTYPPSPSSSTKPYNCACCQADSVQNPIHCVDVTHTPPILCSAPNETK